MREDGAADGAADGAVVRVLLVGDRRLPLEAVLGHLRRRPELAVVGDAPAAGEALAALRGAAAGGAGTVEGVDAGGGGDAGALPVDVALVDAGRGDEAAHRAVRCLSDAGVPVLAFGIADAAEAVRFVEAGAAAYLGRDAGLDGLVTAACELARGRVRCAPAVAERALRRLSDLVAARPPESPEDAGLTERETEVLGRIADGLANKEIAAALGIALSTVKNHVHSLLGKLGVGRRRDAVRVACERGLLDGPPRWRGPGWEE